MQGETDLPRGTETILVVEDDAETRSMAVQELKSLGYYVLQAANGDEALRVIIGHGGRPIDLLFANLAMPRTGGRELACWLQDVYPETKVLFSRSVTNSDKIRQELLNSQVNFLEKPYTPVSLAQKVRSILEI